jgi:hypothetical protein
MTPANPILQLIGMLAPKALPKSSSRWNPSFRLQVCRFPRLSLPLQRHLRQGKRRPRRLGNVADSRCYSGLVEDERTG